MIDGVEYGYPGVHRTFNKALDKLNSILDEYPEDKYILRVCELDYS